MTLASIEARLRGVALGYPESHEDVPWGERVVKVRGKIFLFLSRNPETLGFTVKLPASNEFARMMGAEPTGYGLGRAGWVTLHLREGNTPDLEMLEGFIDESYRAVAPKRLVAGLSRP